MSTRSVTPFRVAVAAVLLLVVAAGVVVGVLGVMAWRGGGDPAVRVMSEAEAVEATQELGSKYSSASGNQRDLTPLIAEAEALLEQQPDVAPLHTLLAQMLLDRGQWERAQGHIERSLELDPDQPQLQAMAGSVAFNLRRLEQARRFYGNAAEFDPQDATFRVKLANALIEAGELDEAETVLDEALRLDATMHQAEAALADLAARRGGERGMQEADERLRRAADLAWTAAKGGASGAGEGRVGGEAVAGDAKAKASWGAYIRRRATYASRAGRPNEAALILFELQREPAAIYEREPAQQIAQALAESGDAMQAAIFFQDVTLVHPEQAWAWALAARYSLAAGEVAAARDAARRLRALDPAHGDLAALERGLAELSPDPTSSGPSSAGSSGVDTVSPPEADPLSPFAP